MDTKNAHQSEIDELRAKKETILSLFQNYEKKIDNRIAQISEETEALKQESSIETAFNADAVFEKAVQRSRQHVDTRFRNPEMEAMTEKRPRHPAIELADTDEIPVIRANTPATEPADVPAGPEAVEVPVTDETIDLSDMAAMLDLKMSTAAPEEKTEEGESPEEAVTAETIDLSGVAAVLKQSEPEPETAIEAEPETETEVPDTPEMESEPVMEILPETPAAAEPADQPQEDTPEPETKTAFDAFFEDFEHDEEDPFEQMVSEPEPEQPAAAEPESHVADVAPEPVEVQSEPVDLSGQAPADTVVLPDTDTLWESEGTLTGVAHPDTVAAFYAEQEKDQAFYDNTLDDEEPEAAVGTPVLEDERYTGIDARTLGAFRFSAVGFRLTLFVVAMLLTGAFGMVFGASLTKIDYLLLFVICLFTALTVDMSFNAALVVSAAVLVGCFVSFMVSIFQGHTLELFRLGWFVLGPLTILSASALVQKIREIITANQLLHQELAEKTDDEASDGETTEN